MHILRFLLTVIIAFTFGFFIHALYFPDLFSNGIFLMPSDVLGTKNNTVEPTPVTKFTLVTFDGEKFKRTNITIERSRYVGIVNQSDTLMWLTSDIPELATVRGYGKTEQATARIDQPGRYTIKETKTGAILVITAK